MSGPRSISCTMDAPGDPWGGKPSAKLSGICWDFCAEFCRVLERIVLGLLIISVFGSPVCCRVCYIGSKQRITHSALKTGSRLTVHPARRLSLTSQCYFTPTHSVRLLIFAGPRAAKAARLNQSDVLHHAVWLEQTVTKHSKLDFPQPEPQALGCSLWVILG